MPQGHSALNKVGIWQCRPCCWPIFISGRQNFVDLVFLCLEIESLKKIFIHTVGLFLFHRCQPSSLFVWHIYLTSVFVFWLPFAETLTHRAQAQADDIILKHLELLFLTNDKTFQTSLKTKIFFKKTSSTFVRKKKLYIQQTEFVFMI